jgi:hypothetical protein
MKWLAIGRGWGFDFNIRTDGSNIEFANGKHRENLRIYAKKS